MHNNHVHFLFPVCPQESDHHLFSPRLQQSVPLGPHKLDSRLDSSLGGRIDSSLGGRLDSYPGVGAPPYSTPHSLMGYSPLGLSQPPQSGHISPSFPSQPQNSPQVVTKQEQFPSGSSTVNQPLKLLISLIIILSFCFFFFIPFPVYFILS